MTPILTNPLAPSDASWSRKAPPRENARKKERQTRRTPPSFPGSAWERTAARLCLAAHPRAKEDPVEPAALQRGRASRAVRSQAEPGNEGDPLSFASLSF